MHIILLLVVLSQVALAADHDVVNHDQGLSEIEAEVLSKLYPIDIPLPQAFFGEDKNETVLQSLVDCQDFMVIALQGGTICIENMKQKRLKETIKKAHEESVSQLIACDGYFLSGGDGNKVYAWNFEGQKLATFQTEAGRQWQGLLVQDGKIFAGSYSRSRGSEITVWHDFSPDPVAKLNTSGRCMALCEGKLYTPGSSHRGSLAVFNAQTYEKINVLPSHSHAIEKLLAAYGKIYAAYNDGSFEIWNAKENKVIKGDKAHK